jgi:Ser/Thr protein kinase RdoA (MazF antagonist)
VLAAVCSVFAALPSAGARGQVRLHPAALEGAPVELIDRLRAEPFAYFRFINRAWTTRVCDAFADAPDVPIVRLHGDAHVEQFALTKDAWGLDDFDDSARGPAVVDIVRFLGSIDLATRQLGWTRDRDRLWDRFLEGYRRGLADSAYRPAEPDLVRQLRKQSPTTHAAYLAWGDNLMQPMDAGVLKSVTDAMTAFERFVRRERPDLAPGYFDVVRAGWLRIGIGSAGTRKVLIRVQGATSDPADDELIEAKEVANLNGVACLEPTPQQAARVIDGTRQLGRLKHDILAIGPTMLLAAAADRAEPWLDWWVSSWEPTYREVHLSDLRSVDDLADIVFDSGVQLGAGKVFSVRTQALSSVVSLDGRLRKETSAIVEELLEDWRQLGGR